MFLGNPWVPGSGGWHRLKKSFFSKVEFFSVLIKLYGQRWALQLVCIKITSFIIVYIIFLSRITNFSVCFRLNAFVRNTNLPTRYPFSKIWKCHENRLKSGQGSEILINLYCVIPHQDHGRRVLVPTFLMCCRAGARTN